MKKNKKNNQSKNNVAKTPKQESDLQKFIKHEKEPKALVLTPEYRETVKFNRWCKAFLDKGSKTYGNATQSALQVYNTESYSSAGRIGFENTKKLKNLGTMIADSEGKGYAERMKKFIEKGFNGSFDEMERLMIRLGDFEPEEKSPTLNQFNFNMGDAINQSRRERGLDD